MKMAETVISPISHFTPISFDDQFSDTDTTPFTYNVIASLDFPTTISLAKTRFFRKCFATAQTGHTVILIGGFLDKPSNRKIRNRLSRISSAAHHHAHILLTFPSSTFPAGTVRGWPESRANLRMMTIIHTTAIHSVNGFESAINP